MKIVHKDLKEKLKQSFAWKLKKNQRKFCFKNLKENDATHFAWKSKRKTEAIFCLKNKMEGNFPKEIESKFCLKK